jgi:hypothetical protein
MCSGKNLFTHREEHETTLITGIIYLTVPHNFFILCGVLAEKYILTVMKDAT